MAVITLLTRAGCGMCERAHDELTTLVDELRTAGGEVGYEQIDVDAPGNTEYRGEYGDMLPVVLLDGAMHSYWDVDAAGLRAELGP